MGLHRRLVWKVAKGFRGRAGNCIKIARQQAEKALQHAYRGRKEKKRDVRALWITRINAGAREHGVRRHARFIRAKCAHPLAASTNALHTGASRAPPTRWPRSAAQGLRPTFIMHTSGKRSRHMMLGRPAHLASLLVKDFKPL